VVTRLATGHASWHSHLCGSHLGRALGAVQCKAHIHRDRAETSTSILGRLCGSSPTVERGRPLGAGRKHACPCPCPCRTHRYGSDLLPHTSVLRTTGTYVVLCACTWPGLDKLLPTAARWWVRRLPKRLHQGRLSASSVVTVWRDSQAVITYTPYGCRGRGPGRFQEPGRRPTQLIRLGLLEA
jgi:hypothetical protein